MKKIYTALIYIFFLMAMTCASAQNFKAPDFKAPDYSAIQQAINNPTSPYYYPPLLKRLRAYDPTLTDKEFQHLYYGYVFNENYSPYRYLDKQKQDKFDVIIKYYNQDQYASADAQQLIELGNQYLDLYPFDNQILKLMQSVYTKEGNQTRAVQMRWVLNNLFITLITSGDAKSCDSAIHVLFIEDEYYFLERLKITRDKLTGQSLIGKCDLIRLDKNKVSAQIDGFYFNIEQLQENFLKNLKG